MALQCGLRYPEKLAGILVLSAWLPIKDTVTQEKSVVNQNTPILMQHGTHDELIPLSWAESSRNYLQDLGYNVELSSYPMQHTVCAEEINKISNWLKKVLF